jgi:hypothetical protein
MPKPKSPIIEQLHALAGDPQQQAAYAAGLLEGKHGKDVMQAALTVLAANPLQAARDSILRLYAYYAANKGVRDQGAYFRRALLDALRPIARRADAELLAQAAATYEFWTPDFAEDAVLLRAAALIALAEVDEETARYHAARLLVDPYVQPMSGEPASSAARVLGALGELTVLWSYVMAEHPPQLAEVVAECLRQLTAVPEQLLGSLIERFGPQTALAGRLGLVHLLINHAAGPQGRDYLLRQLQETRDSDVYRYIVMSIVASGREPLLDDLRESARTEQKREKLIVLAEAFDLLAHQPHFRQEADSIKRRLAASRRS